MKIIPVILCGGSGTRLWPVSTKDYPKQFIKIFNNKSLFELTLLRIKKIKNASNPIIVANKEYKFLINKILKENKMKCKILLEPLSRNTAAAIYLSTKLAKENDRLIFLPSDHLIKDNTSFIKSIEIAINHKIFDKWVTFGVHPTSPKTGFGYIRIDRHNAESSVQKPYDVINFTEKPDKSLAEKMLSDGNHFWNSGIFMCSASLVRETLMKCDKDIIQDCDTVWLNKETNQNFITFDKNNFKKIRSKSIDYVLMKTPKIILMFYLVSNWNDIGTWDNFCQIDNNDKTVEDNKIVSLNSNNNFIYPTNKIVATIDVDNLIVVDTDLSLLIVKKGSSEKVRNLISKIPKQDNSSDLNDNIRPWGFYEMLLESDETKVKRLHIFPNESISYQFHNYRNEHWVIVKGEAKIIIDGECKILKTNDHIYIPFRQKHSVENISNQNLVIIETQTGTYFGEDDIIRITDKYGRK